MSTPTMPTRRVFANLTLKRSKPTDYETTTIRHYPTHRDILHKRGVANASRRAISRERGKADALCAR